MREVRRNTFTSFAISFSLSISHLLPARASSGPACPRATTTATVHPYSNSSHTGCGSLVFEISSQLLSSYPGNIRRSAFRKHCEQRRNRRLELAHTGEHLVVLKRAETSGLRVATPGRVTCCSRYAAQHVDQLRYFSISFHFSPFFLKSSICSRSNCLPRCTRHFTVESGAPRNAAMRLSGISSKKRSRRTRSSRTTARKASSGSPPPATSPGSVPGAIPTRPR